MSVLTRTQSKYLGVLPIFYHDEAHCNGMAWPPYNLEKELTCAVFIDETRQHNEDDMSSCAPGAI